MSSWSELPNEILSIIFSYLKEKDLAQCALICCKWRMEAQLNFFSSIRLRSEIHIEKINHLVSVNSMIGNWVKGVKIDYKCSGNVLSTIDTLFPKLEDLNLGSQDGSCYSFFLKMITGNNKFVNLKSVPYFNSFGSRTDDLYVQCLSYMKQRLTSIRLSEYSADYKSSYLSLRHKLNQFSSLRKISVVSYDTTETRSVTQYLESLTNYSTTSLKEIYLNIEDRDEPSFAAPTELLKINHTINSMKELTIHLSSINTVPVPDEKFMIYLMNKFPKLKALKLANFRSLSEEGDIDFSNYYFPVAFNGAMQTPEVALQFLNYLYKIPNCSVQNIIIPIDTPINVIYDFYKGIETQSVTGFSNCLETASQVRKISGDENSVNTSISYESDSSKKTRKITVSFDRTDALYDEQQLRLIEKCGQFFYTMCLEITATVKFGRLLDYIARYCSRLNNLVISNERIIGNPFKKEKKAIVEDLGVTCLALCKFIPPPEQFPYISLCFPHLKTLILDQCFESLIDEGSFFTFRMPESCLKNIKIEMQMVIDINEMNTTDTLYIKVTTETQKADRFFIIRTWEENFLLLREISTDLTEVDYENSIPNQNILTCHIHCKSFDTITMEYNASNHLVPIIATF